MQDKLILDYVFANEKAHANSLFLTQPLGGDRVAQYTWSQAVDQARRMAAHLQAQGLEPGARIAILSKNCAHFIMAELAICGTSSLPKRWRHHSRSSSRVSGFNSS